MRMTWRMNYSQTTCIDTYRLHVNCIHLNMACIVVDDGAAAAAAAPPLLLPRMLHAVMRTCMIDGNMTQPSCTRMITDVVTVTAVYRHRRQ